MTIPGGRGTIREDPNLTFPLQLHRHQRKRFLWRLWARVRGGNGRQTARGHNRPDPAAAGAKNTTGNAAKNVMRTEKQSRRSPQYRAFSLMYSRMMSRRTSCRYAMLWRMQNVVTPVTQCGVQASERRGRLERGAGGGH